MLRYALRRMLWSVPALLATSFILFFVTTLAPPPVAEDDAHATSPAEPTRRARFLDLPRFVNQHPVDVHTRAAAALAHVAAGDDQHDRAARELVRLGGAAFPYVLPDLEALEPEARRRVAIALGPVAVRMGLAEGLDLADPDAATLFWTRFWDDRALDFTRPVVTRAVDRFVEHGSDAREDDLRVLDTFALPAVLRALRTTRNPATRLRLSQIAQHAAARGPVIDFTSAPDRVRREIADWREWWFVYGTDFVALSGAERSIATITDTQYGKWLRRIANGELGLSLLDGEPIADKLRARAPVTMLVCALAMLASGALAVPLGALGAWRRGSVFDVTTSAALFLLYAVPTFVLAEVLLRIGGRGTALPEALRVTLAVAAVSAGSLATLSRWQRVAILDVLSQDFIRTARAKGAPGLRVLVVHALRNALAPMVTVMGLQLPVLLAGACVVEDVFGLPGIGFETLRALEVHDAPWLMAVLLPTSVAVTLGLVVSDVAYAALDPQLRELLATRQGRSAP